MVRPPAPGPPRPPRSLGGRISCFCSGDGERWGEKEVLELLCIRSSVARLGLTLSLRSSAGARDRGSVGLKTGTSRTTAAAVQVGKKGGVNIVRCVCTYIIHPRTRPPPPIPLAVSERGHNHKSTQLRRRWRHAIGRSSCEKNVNKNGSFWERQKKGFTMRRWGRGQRRACRECRQRPQRIIFNGNAILPSQTSVVRRRAACIDISYRTRNHEQAKHVYHRTTSPFT